MGIIFDYLEMAKEVERIKIEENLSYEEALKKVKEIYLFPLKYLHILL